MKPEHLHFIRKSHGLTQGRLASILGVSEKTVSRWETGFTPIPHAIALLVEIIDRVPAVRRHLELEA